MCISFIGLRRFLGLPALVVCLRSLRVHKAVPHVLVVVVLSSLLTRFADLESLGVTVVGEVPAGLPSFRLVSFDPSLWASLLIGAVTIAFVSFVESVSIANISLKVIGTISLRTES